MTIELTERCDNACVHCYVNRPAGDPEAIARELSTERIRAILDEAAALGTWSVRFTGGEPLLRADFDEIYLHARSLGLRVSLSTNARGVTIGRAELFARVLPLETIDVTVYGMRRETYEGISRVPGSFEEFRRGIDLLVEYRIPFVVRAALLPSFEKDRDEFEAWAKTIPWMEGPPSYTTEFDLRARRDNKSADERIRGLRTAVAGNRNPVAERPEYLREMAAFCERLLRPVGEQLFQCGAGRKCAVDAYGTLQPCLLLRHPDVCVDLTSTSLRDAGIEMRDRLAELRAQDTGYRERCARCFLKNLCQQCPAKSWMESGTLDVPVDYNCQLAHAQARHLGLLRDGESAWDVLDWRNRIYTLSARASGIGFESRTLSPGSGEGDGDEREEELGKA